MLPSLIFLAAIRAHRVVAYDRKAAAQSHHDILRLDDAYELVRNKSTADFGVGHVLAMMFIPIEFLGVYHLQGILLLHHRSTGEETTHFAKFFDPSWLRRYLYSTQRAPSCTLHGRSCRSH